MTNDHPGAAACRSARRLQHSARRGRHGTRKFAAAAGGRGLALVLLLAFAFALALATPRATAQTVTLRVANQGDALSMDPHSFNEAVQISVTGNIYEPLVARDRDLRLIPGLAVAWRTVSPTVWRFELRRGVLFHDGSPLTADDVVFSLQRAAGEGSDMRNYTASFREVRKVDAHTVDIETSRPFPILPDVISILYIMNRQWCLDQNAERPADRRRGVENTASFRANGTGPYRLKERQPSTRTVLVRNPRYWDSHVGNVDEIVFTPIANDATRVAALLSGEIDLMDPVPLQDVERVRAHPQLKVMQTPELRTIFLGMDQKRDELLYSSVKGRNPFRDVRVRRAFYQAIDIQTIASRVMRNAATPTALLVAPGVNGHIPDIDKRLPYDPEAARRLLAEAGYPNGFDVAMNCPNDRYVNDSEICQAVAANLARIGVKVNLQAESKATYFPKVLRRDTSFYLLGWTPPTYDAHNVLTSLIATPDGKGNGTFNLGAYSNPRIDGLIERIQGEVDASRRTAMIREAFQLHHEDVGHVPLHQQPIVWGMKRNVDVAQRADNVLPFKWVRMQK